MNWGVIIAIVVVAAGVAAWTAATWTQRRTEREASALRQEMQNLLATQAQGLTAQLGQLSQAVTQQLGKSRSRSRAAWRPPEHWFLTRSAP